jgi:hypothetical protein
MENTMTDIFKIQTESNDNIEAIENKELNEENNVIPIEAMLNNINNETTQIKQRKKDKILIIQVILLVIWVILTALIYFFGYDLFSPFINV